MWKHNRDFNLSYVAPSLMLLLFAPRRSFFIQADGVCAGGPGKDGDVGSGAAALWRTAERRLSRLPVYRSQQTGDRHARVFPG